MNIISIECQAIECTLCSSMIFLRILPPPSLLNSSQKNETGMNTSAHYKTPVLQIDRLTSLYRTSSQPMSASQIHKAIFNIFATTIPPWGTKNKSYSDTVFPVSIAPKFLQTIKKLFKDQLQRIHWMRDPLVASSGLDKQIRPSTRKLTRLHLRLLMLRIILPPSNPLVIEILAT